jgi:hypothetical protein
MLEGAARRRAVVVARARLRNARLGGTAVLRRSVRSRAIRVARTRGAADAPEAILHTNIGLTIGVRSARALCANAPRHRVARRVERAIRGCGALRRTESAAARVLYAVLRRPIRCGRTIVVQLATRAISPGQAYRARIAETAIHRRDIRRDVDRRAPPAPRAIAVLGAVENRAHRVRIRRRRAVAAKAVGEVARRIVRVAAARRAQVSPLPWQLRKGDGA